MDHIYLSFDFGTDEEKAQQARHKLEMWKQAFRLDKKLLYKFARAADNVATEERAVTEEKSQKASKATKSAKAGKAKAESGKPGASDGSVKLYLRLAFSDHEKMTEERWLKKFPSEEPFRELSAKAVREGDTGFRELEEKFDALD